MNDEIIERFDYDSGKPGPHFLVLGGVHGTEPCGPKAIALIRAGLECGQIHLTAGQLTFVPECNPRALEQQLRYIERNLNRLLFPKVNPQTYEDRLGNQLCPILAEADYVLDLHSSQTTDRDFVFLGRPGDEEELAFAKALGTNTYFYGFAESYSKVGKGTDPQTGMGTTEYARTQKARAAITLECGQHEDPNGEFVGAHAIVNALKYLNMGHVDPNFASLLKSHPGKDYPERVVRIDLPVFKREDGKFTKPWRHMMRVQSGETIATYQSGATDIAPYDGYIIMPREIDEVGQDWFMLGVEASFAEFMAQADTGQTAKARTWPRLML
jgi:predicted deacylase